jgi:G:T-mismatch repair DNA endonuclease (very short patch repair protein)
LKEATIGQIPTCGYGGANINQSAIALCWLREIENELHENNHRLNSKLSVGGETKILDHFVDGYCDDTRTIYQFHRCFYHGCKKCYDGEAYNQIVHERFFILRARTQRMTVLFRQHVYKVVEKWECDYRKESHISADQIKRISLGEFFENLNLNPRDALFGGRTSLAILYYDREGDLKKRKVRYYDVTSLYPFVQKMFDFPTQHPVIFHGEVCNSKNPKHIFGLIKCKILPPTKLLFPVLPYRSEGKLTFPLCRKCVCECAQRCTHGDEERALYGTWTSVEVQKALELGYRILNVYEIYHFEKPQKIFDDYVNTFMKLKQESSGMPKHCLDANGVVIKEKLQKYIMEYLEHKQVQLDAEKINYNPGQRTVMKALLNSLSFLDSMDELLELVNDRTIEVTSLDFISDNVARTTHRKVSCLMPLPNRNVIIASFVTAYACLELFKYIHKLGENVLYYDTDSVIFIEDTENGKCLQIGEYL